MSESFSNAYLKLEEKRKSLNALLLSVLKHVPSFKFRGLTLSVPSMMFDLMQPYTVGEHQHGEFEVTICEWGEYLNTSDGVVSIFRKDAHSVLVMPPATLHRREYTKRLTLNLTFHINVPVVELHEKRLLEEIQNLCAQKKFKFPLDGLSAILFRQFRNQLPLWGGRDPATVGLLAAAFLSAFFHSIFGEIEPPPLTHFDSQDFLVEQIKLRVQKYLNGKYFSEEYLQSNFNLSANYLNRIFRDRTGMSIRRYWQQQRLLLLRSLIENTDTKFCEIARILGFCNPAQFSAYTRHHTGKSPSELRQATLR